MAESLAALQRENIIKRAERERQKAQAAEEEKRLMQEYKEKLDRYQETVASCCIAQWYPEWNCLVF